MWHSLLSSSAFKLMQTILISCNRHVLYEQCSFWTPLCVKVCWLTRAAFKWATYVNKASWLLHNHRFKPLDQSTWNDDNSFIPPSITALAKMFKMDPVLLNKQFSTLSTSIIKDLTFWCVNQGSEPSFFWTEVLDNFKVPVELTTLIKSAMAIPYSRYY